MKVIAKHYNMNINDIRSKKRNQEISTVRQVAFYLMKKLSFCSLQIIGSYVGGRDHSTVIHAIGKVEQLLKTDHIFAQKVTALEQDILNS
jgi:chromosomal replication initiator protein